MLHVNTGFLGQALETVPLDILPHTFHKLENIIGMHAIKTDHEFLAACTGDQWPFTDKLAQNPGKFLQNGVAGCMPIGIVQCLEIVDIANGDPARAPFFPCERAL
jgi:hypothetical protein